LINQINSEFLNFLGDFMRIGDRIMIAARLRGITQAEIAERLDISAAAVSAWAKKGANPPSKRLSEIADILGVSADFLLTGKGGPPDLNLDSIYTDDNTVERGQDEQGELELSKCLAIIESQQSAILTLSNTNADQTTIIKEIVVGDDKKARRGGG
jgi:transcriptional regulator with XRE-family HTH domain